MKRTLSELREAVAAGPPYGKSLLSALRADSRAGAKALYDSCIRKQKQADNESNRLRDMMRFEEEARAGGFERVAGVDEAGRGPLAGPIVAAAVVLDGPVRGVNDSKQLTPAQREGLFVELHRGGHSIGVAILDAEFIDKVGIQSANYLALMQAAAKLDPPPDFILVDGFAIPGCRFPQKRVIQGDRKSLCIAAASIVAKVVRDRIMTELDRRFPAYGFARHKGYATSDHLDAIRRHGPCPVHRTSFSPLCGTIQTDLFTRTSEEHG